MSEPSATSQALLKTARPFYHPELDVLRFFAFFLVFVGHSEYVLSPHLAANPFIANTCVYLHRVGFSGVGLFFTLSAFLITELLLQEQDKTGSIHFRGFYLRRILRIWPLYFFFLLVVRPFVARYIPWEHFPHSYLLSYFLMVGNWECLRHGWPASVASPLWSISMEEQFYLVWPLLMASLRKHLLTLTLAVLVIANISRWVMVVFYVPTDPGMWCNTLARLDPFALGALLAYALHGRRFDIPAAARALLFLLGFILLVLNSRFGEHIGPQALYYYPVEALACLMMLAATLLPMGSWRPGWIGKTFVYLGRISYGLYVFHLVYLDLLAPTKLGFWSGKVIAMALTIATASVSYYLLERPFLLLKQRFTYVRSRL